MLEVIELGYTCVDDIVPYMLSVTGFASSFFFFSSYLIYISEECLLYKKEIDLIYQSLPINLFTRSVVAAYPWIGCQAVLNVAAGESTTFNTIGYPSDYSNNEFCFWTIQGEPGVNLRGSVTGFSLGEKSQRR